MNRIWKAVKEETLEHEKDLYVLAILGYLCVVFKNLFKR